MHIINDAGKPIAIVDMDNTKADLGKTFDQQAEELLPPEVWANRNVGKYWIEDIFPDPAYHKPLNEILTKPGFFLNLDPMPGAIQAIHEMIEEGIAIRICTTPHPYAEFCINEKNAWIRKYLGEEFVMKTIFTYDKTLIHGDILIDDKPEIIGLKESPSWTHVVYDYHHNQHVDTQHRLKQWKDWRKVIHPILKNLGY